MIAPLPDRRSRPCEHATPRAPVCDACRQRRDAAAERQRKRRGEPQQENIDAEIAEILSQTPRHVAANADKSWRRVVYASAPAPEPRSGPSRDRFVPGKASVPPETGLSGARSDGNRISRPLAPDVTPASEDGAQRGSLPEVGEEARTA
jgi:hypothetical protein